MIDVKMIAMTKEMKVVKGKIARLENNASIYEMILKKHKDMCEIYSCKMNNSKTINLFIYPDLENRHIVMVMRFHKFEKQWVSDKLIFFFLHFFSQVIFPIEWSHLLQCVLHFYILPSVLSLSLQLIL